MDNPNRLKPVLVKKQENGLQNSLENLYVPLATGIKIIFSLICQH